jgi:hypothetical protein
MFAFLHTHVYKNEVFAITDCGEVWRLRMATLHLATPRPRGSL